MEAISEFVGMCITRNSLSVTSTNSRSLRIAFSWPVTLSRQICDPSGNISNKSYSLSIHLLRGWDSQTATTGALALSKVRQRARHSYSYIARQAVRSASETQASSYARPDLPSIRTGNLLLRRSLRFPEGEFRTDHEAGCTSWVRKIPDGRGIQA
jgi:hypothetical protein